jgi:gliding motility-associated-like protein
MDDGLITLSWTSTYSGCTEKSAQQTIDAFLEPTQAVLGADTILCDASSFMLTSSTINSGTGTWSVISGSGLLSNETDTSATLTFQADDSVRISHVVSNGVCSDHYSEQLVTSTSYPEIQLIDDTTIFYGEIAQVQAYVNSTFDISYLWTPDLDLSNPFDSIVDLSPIENRTYYVTVTNSAGCSSIDSIEIIVSDEIHVYTGLTPNGDGKNDTWIIRGIDQYPNSIIRVFNLWGTMVFESTGYEDPWDGTYNGNPVPFGAYYYTIDIDGDGKVDDDDTVTVIK